MPEPSLTRRIVMAAAMSTVIVLLAALVSALLLLKSHHERGFDARLLLDARTLLSGLSRDKEGILTIGTLPDDSRYQDRLSGWYWIVRDSSGPLVRSRSLGTSDLSHAAAASALTGPRNERLRAVTLTRAQDATFPGLEVVVAGPQSEIDHALFAEALALIAGAAVLAILLTLALWWQVHRSLQPLHRMISSIGALRDGRIETLPAAEYAELSKLTAVINDLLQHSRTLVANYRDSAAKLAHALKTPLALIAARAGAGGESPDANVMEAVAAMRRHIDRNLKPTRAASRSPAFAQRIKVAPVVAELLFALGHAYAAKNVKQHQSVPVDLEFAGDKEDLEEMLGNLIENAHKWARANVRVHARTVGGELTISVEDDGPGFKGLPDATHEDGESGIQEFGLAVTRQLAANYGGSLTLHNSSSGGALAVLALPRPPRSR
ncbi:MAG: ATP-binding protein [Pseudomonadota bacterium]